jgi:thiol-disulfide isomerase/thioredoxin
MALLSGTDRETVKELLAGMTDPVRLVFFTQSFGCETCLPTRQILDELVELAGGSLSVEEYNLVLDKEKAAEYGVDRVPAIAVVGGRGAGDPGVRFYGIPAGYEFMSLIDAVILVSTGESGLSDESRTLAAAVDRPVTIQVFVTPT